MGSWLSGRPPKRPKVESGLILDINQHMDRRAFVPGERTAATVTWSSGPDDKNPSRIRLIADLTDERAPSVRLSYRINGTAHDYKIDLDTTRCRFGGVRWWWICPRQHRLASKLYLPAGATIFASRHAYRMTYRSESGGPIDRSHRRLRHLFAKLGGEYRIFEQCPPKRPKGMHCRTYERLLAEIKAAERHHNAIFEAGAAPLLARIMR